MIASRVMPLGDSSIVLQYDAAIDPIVNARCVAAARAIELLAIAGVRDVVPTYNAVTVHFDARITDRQALSEQLRGVAALVSPSEMNARVVEVPVRYGGAAGPDLAAVAAFAGCSEADVVGLHTGQPYRVYMLGFLPGYPYMGSVDPRIAMPRLDTPRLRVPAGSVGIAGAQTGIYPCDSPGGWRLIGRTEVALFDPARPSPFFFQAGDRVTFVAV